MAWEHGPDTSEYAEFYRTYVALVPPGNIIAVLLTQLEDSLALLRELTDDQALHAYRPGKWSIKQVVGHLADTERVMAYRALTIARGDTASLPGFDENAWVAGADFNARRLAGLLAELTAARRSTAALLTGLSADAWTRTGTANQRPVSVRALAWIIAGHELHHREILVTRYLAGLPRATGGAGRTEPAPLPPRT